MNNQNPSDQLWLMLGEIRADLKHLLHSQTDVTRRLDDIEIGAEAKFTDQDNRLRVLEGWKIRIGVITAALGVLVPTALSVAVKMMGL